MNKETRQLCRQLEEQGFSTKLSKSGHLKIYAPSGRMISSMGTSPSGGRHSHQNTLAYLKRHGFRPKSTSSARC